MINKNDLTNEKKVTQGVLFAVMAIILAFVLVLLLVENEDINFNFNKPVSDPGQIGDLIGGISAPFIGLIGALLTFLAFWIQYRFNEFQTEKMERTRIEGLFYEMLRIHRENVSEITIKDTSKSRRAFISMFKEFKFCYYTLIEVYDRYKINNPEFTLDDKKLVNISFITFFFGIGESSEDIVNSLLTNYPEIFKNAYYERLFEFQEKWKCLDKELKSSRKQTEVDTKLSGISPQARTITISVKNRVDYSFTAGYKPFSGHLARLGHYFRHLFQTVYFIDKQDISDKHDYVRILRAQISAHEQLLLYYNSLTTMGDRWWTEGFIKKYGMVKNIPLPLADVGPKPTELLGIEYFEWSEITNSIKGQDIFL